LNKSVPTELIVPRYLSDERAIILNIYQQPIMGNHRERERERPPVLSGHLSCQVTSLEMQTALTGQLS